MNHGKKTHLHAFHSQRGKIETFAGFEMPIWYEDIIPEHLAVRNNVGIFDITHMGRTTVAGTDAEAFLNYVTTNDVSKLGTLSAHYTVMCNDRGGIKDDFVLYRQAAQRFLMVYNAANRTKNFAWLKEQARRFNVEIHDVSDDVAMFAVQGPDAGEALQKVASGDLNNIGRFKCGQVKLAGEDVFLSRTGYTGEDGFEVFIWNTHTSSPERAVKVWNTILEAGQEFNIKPCGLGARDTLRLEAGMCLYGNDIDETTTPLEARISFVVKLQKEAFIGKEALLAQKAEGLKRRRVGLRMVDAGIPRPKHELLKNGETIGHITSGTFSPLLQQGIAMGYVSTEHALRGEVVSVKIRGRLAKAEVAGFPLYDPDRYGYKRKT